jgi:hypothetical protein
MATNTTTDSIPTLDSLFPHHDLDGSLKDHFDTQTLIQKLVQYVKLIPNFNTLKLSPAVTLKVMNILKSEISNPDTDQVELLVQVLTMVFNLNSNETVMIKQQALFLQKDLKIIKGIPLSKKFVKTATRWLSRKLG